MYVNKTREAIKKASKPLRLAYNGGIRTEPTTKEKMLRLEENGPGIMIVEENEDYVLVKYYHRV